MSRFLSLVLRHDPGRLGLEMDPDGFVALDALLAAMRREPAWRDLGMTEIEAVVAASDKQRFELRPEQDARWIRARYGHSLAERVEYPPVEPPEVLFHGTSRRALAGIRAAGLRPMRRQYVHLATAPELALQVGRRHDRDPVLITVLARAAWQAGVPFYRPEERLFLAGAIPPAWLRFEERDPA